MVERERERERREIKLEAKRGRKDLDEFEKKEMKIQKKSKVVVINDHLGNSSSGNRVIATGRRMTRFEMTESVDEQFEQTSTMAKFLLPS